VETSLQTNWIPVILQAIANNERKHELTRSSFENVINEGGMRLLGHDHESYSPSIVNVSNDIQDTHAVVNQEISNERKNRRNFNNT
jgi:hypothetical protein